MKQVMQRVIKTATILILILAITTLAVARDKKEKAKPGPYVFTTKASAHTVKVLIVQESLRDGYAVDTDTDSDHELQFRFSRPARGTVRDSSQKEWTACKAGHGWPL